MLFTKILRFLAPRPRSTSEIKSRLTRYGATPEQVVAIIHKLTGLHYLDDASFATYLVNSRRSQGRSLRHIEHELAHFGIAKEDSATALLHALQDSSVIPKLIQEKARLSRVELTRYLARRGFSWSDIKAALQARSIDEDTPLAVE